MQKLFSDNTDAVLCKLEALCVLKPILHESNCILVILLFI